QHHHAHLAACLAEHGVDGPAVGAIYDGTGYGTDGTVWGGELLLGDAADFERVGHVWPVRLPGGEAAIRQPWRMACAWLREISTGTPAIPAWLDDSIDAKRWEVVSRLAGSGVAAPLTTSVGRLFDAVGALCGLRLAVRYEGQAAIELEMAASQASDPEGDAYPLPLRRAPDAPARLDGRDTVRAALADLEQGTSAPLVALRFHHGLADGTAAACVAEAGRAGVDTVVLSGGVFQNVLLLERTAYRLSEAGLRVLVPRRLPPNDGGIAYGQAAVLAARGG
ncbi:MAG: carbamoyltransferase HypF, partial [Gemmatimonadota bacterium]|nr:carbamoyltransferase HypF [Gemmatimonadota bacterium]